MEWLLVQAHRSHLGSNVMKSLTNDFLGCYISLSGGPILDAVKQLLKQEKAQYTGW